VRSVDLWVRGVVLGAETRVAARAFYLWYDLTAWAVVRAELLAVLDRALVCELQPG
jgi:hypothetical protein